MAEFPSKVSTQTSTPDASSGGGFWPKPDLTFIMSIPGILMMVELVSTRLLPLGGRQSWLLVSD